MKSRIPQIYPQSFFLVGAVIAVFLAGKFPEASVGFFLIFAGLAFLLFPPQVTIPGSLWLIGVLVIGTAATALLPQAWFGVPLWRKHLMTLPIPLAAAVSPVPKETGFWLVLLAVSTGSLLFSLAHPLRSKSLLSFTSAAILATAVYAGLAIYAEISGWVFAFDFGRNFGFFPNRNNTAAFLEAGSLLCLGVLGVVKGGSHWKSGLLAAIGLIVNATALIFFSGSRGGVLFLITGVLLWFCSLGRAHWSKRIVVSFAGLTIAGLILLVVSGSEARGRLGELFSPKVESEIADPGNEHGPVNGREKVLDGRILIYRDTWTMVKAFPWTGVGLGGFRHVFPQYRNASLAEAMSIHPESDWLMLAVEAGIPALLATVTGFGLLLKRIRHQREHPYWPLRAGLICAVSIVILHGVVDVPLHRSALGWFILVLAGAAFQTFPERPERPPWGQRLSYWVAGLSALALGVFSIRSEWFQGASSPFLAAAKTQQRVQVLMDNDQLERAVDVVSDGIKQSPMASDLYYQKGVLKLSFNDTDAEVDGLFAAERALNPDWPLISVNQGLAWMNYDRIRAAQCWQEALLRERRLDEVQGNENRGTLSLFESLLAQSARFPEVQRRLLEQNRGNMALALLWLERVDKALAAGEIARFAEDAGFFEKLGAMERKRFLKVWYEKGDGDALFAFLDQHPEWEKEGWSFRIRRLVDGRQFEEAMAAVVARHPVNLDFASTLAALAALKPSSESEDPLARFAYYWEAGNEITARRILEEATAQAEKAKISPDLWRLTAILAIREGRWEAAWRGLRRYLVESGMDELP